MKQLINNKQTITKNSKRRIFFVLISGIVILTILLAIIFLVKTSSKNKSQQINKENNSKTNELSEQNQVSLQDIENCPYLNETELTTIDPKRKYSKVILSEKDLSQ